MTSELLETALSLACPTCPAGPGERCTGSTRQGHSARRLIAARMLACHWAEHGTLRRGITFAPSIETSDDGQIQPGGEEQRALDQVPHRAVLVDDLERLDLAMVDPGARIVQAHRGWFLEENTGLFVTARGAYLEEQFENNDCGLAEWSTPARPPRHSDL